MADRISLVHRDGSPHQHFDLDHLHSKSAQFAIETIQAPLEATDELE
jgi:hypothetical protein